MYSKGAPPKKETVTRIVAYVRVKVKKMARKAKEKGNNGLKNNKISAPPPCDEMRHADRATIATKDKRKRENGGKEDDFF